MNCQIILNPTGTDPSSTHNNTTANESIQRVPFDKQQAVRISRGTHNNCQATDQKPNQLFIMGSSLDATDIAGSAPPKKKRKQWSKEEDNDLIALVQKYGEKWEILKDDFKYDRTPHQLAHVCSSTPKLLFFSVFSQVAVKKPALELYCMNFCRQKACFTFEK
jgi:Myb-like DNA-binding domain